MESRTPTTPIKRRLTAILAADAMAAIDSLRPSGAGQADYFTMLAVQACNDPDLLPPRFAALLGPSLRTSGACTDTTTGVVATDPAPASGRLWHDRRVRPTSIMRRTRPSERERERFWEWVREAAGVSDD